MHTKTNQNLPTASTRLLPAFSFFPPLYDNGKSKGVEKKATHSNATIGWISAEGILCSSLISCLRQLIPARLRKDKQSLCTLQKGARQTRAQPPGLRSINTYDCSPELVFSKVRPASIRVKLLEHAYRDSDKRVDKTATIPTLLGWLRKMGVWCVSSISPKHQEETGDPIFSLQTSPVEKREKDRQTDTGEVQSGRIPRMASTEASVPRSVFPV